MRRVSVVGAINGMRYQNKFEIETVSLILDTVGKQL